jgi:predicted nucleotidyltransferase
MSKFTLQKCHQILTQYFEVHIIAVFGSKK